MMIIGEGSCRVSKRKIYAAITLEEFAKVQKNVGQITGFSSSKTSLIFAKVLGASKKMI